MSKAFEMAIIEHLGPEALAHGTMSIYQAAEMMKLMEAAELVIDMREGLIYNYTNSKGFNAKTFFTKGDYQSLAYAVLRAASAVLKARGE